MRIHVMVTGRVYHLAQPLPDELTLPDGSTVEDAIRAIAGELPQGEQLPPSCLLAVSGQHLGTLANHASRTLRDGDELTLIAPVAGG